MKRNMPWMVLLVGIFMPFSVAAVSAEHGSQSVDMEEIVVYGRSTSLIGQAASASEGIVGFDDIQLPPLLRVGELTEAVPGMVATQHSGTGKANQYFLRGFNLDHGTDFSARADGVPLNMRSHGHGQGYLDLNFLIPELVQKTKYRKGPYSVLAGDFSAAGSVDFSYYDRLPMSVIKTTMGEHGYRRGLLIGNGPLEGGDLVVGLDVTRYDGPWDIEEDLSQEKLYLGYHATEARNDWHVKFNAYQSEWLATDQIPQRAIDAGMIGRLGAIDPDLGGETRRLSLAAGIDMDQWQIEAYGLSYDFRLFSNFTYFLDDPVNGDEFEQRDKRNVFGLLINGEQALSTLPLVYRWGVEVRHDDVQEVGLYRTQARVRSGIIRQDSLEESSLSGYMELDWSATERLRATLGLRADVYHYDVDALRAANSGSGSDQQLSPKVSLAFTLAPSVELYANYGRSMHSNDVRGVTINEDPVSGAVADSVDLLIPADGAEFGVRFEKDQRFNFSAVAYWLRLDSELVFVGDAGGTEANNGSRRRGIEINSFYRPVDWLALNASYTKNDAHYEDTVRGQDEIPGAIESTFSLGINTVWQNGFSGSLRARYLGESPLTEDGSVMSRSSTLVNGAIAYQSGPLEVRFDVFNLTGSDDQDIAYLYESRLPGEAAAGVSDIHFHPLEPRSMRLTFSWHRHE